MVFYNGKIEIPERQEIRLSDLYKVGDDKPDLELKALVYNINKGNNKELLKKCRTLSEYAGFVARMQAVLIQGLTKDELIKVI